MEVTVECSSSQSEVDALQTDIKVEEYDPVFSGSEVLPYRLTNVFSTEIYETQCSDCSGLMLFVLDFIQSLQNQLHPLKTVASDSEDETKFDLVLILAHIDQLVNTTSTVWQVLKEKQAVKENKGADIDGQRTAYCGTSANDFGVTDNQVLSENSEKAEDVGDEEQEQEEQEEQTQEIQTKPTSPPPKTTARKRKRKNKETCTDCDATFKNLLALKVHVRRAHQERPKEKRKIKATAKVLALKKVAKKVKSVIRRTTEEKMESCVCPVCAKTFKRKDYLKTHMATVHKQEGGVECDQCGRKCANKSKLEIHYNSMHGGEKRVCHVCAKEFTSGTVLKYHIAKVQLQ